MTDLPHLTYQDRTSGLQFTPTGGGGGVYERPSRDRALHAQQLRSDLDSAWPTASSTTEIVQLVYELVPQAKPVIESLEKQRSGVVLLNVVAHGQGYRVTVRVPGDKRGLLERVLARYAQELSRYGRPKNQDLVESIESLRRADEYDLWTSPQPFPQDDEARWWEIWLYEDSEGGIDDVFRQLAEPLGVVLRPQAVHFPDRCVVLAQMSRQAWQENPQLLLFIAELRHVTEPAGPYLNLTPSEQQGWIDEFASRIEAPPNGCPVVCLLDTGVDRHHPLLEGVLSAASNQAVYTAWGTGDHTGEKHGTLMAGLSIYGCLTTALTSTGPWSLTHSLESVKILSAQRSNPPDLYGWITQQAVARAESITHQPCRVICMAITAPWPDGGLPSVWSAAVDQLVAGSPSIDGDMINQGASTSGDPKLIFISAGNLREAHHLTQLGTDYPILDQADAGVEDPGQAWNAVTVGAMTDKTIITDPSYDRYKAIAPAGDLTPTSRTSHAWTSQARRGWPIKPDIVFEGGNWASSPEGMVSDVDDLGLLSTALGQDGSLLGLHRDSSAATALAAKMAAEIWRYYPGLRPETVRALMVHSARWTPAMLSRIAGDRKEDIQNRLRCYGYGVPDLRRAIYSAENAATLVYEGQLSPYREENTKIKSNEMHLHELPWPEKVLQELQELDVEMRVTLSYYIEPSPGRRGFIKRHRYASHGLRFEVKRPTESNDDFIRRINAEVIDDDPNLFSNLRADASPWVVGPHGRTQGSIHSDWWKGNAAELAASGYVAVYPITGWWRERRQLDRWATPARYSLVVSIENREAEIDLYNPITIDTEATIAIEHT